MATLQRQQFSIGQMLAAVMSIAGGLALLSYIRPTDRGPTDELLALGAAAAIGCGIGLMFRRPILGAVLGFGIVLAVLFVTTPPAIRD
jgi:hypothetical protein